MLRLSVVIWGLFAAMASAQETFSVTGTRIPSDLVRLNYGRLPGTIQAFDLNICNQTAEKHSVTSSEIYQALAQSNSALKPLGRQIMLAVILRHQRRSATTVLAVVLNSTVGVLAVLGAARAGVSGNLLAGMAVGASVGQQLLNSLSPVLPADLVQRYESQTLEPALVLDGGSCVERTVFTLGTAPAVGTSQSLIFHVR